VKPINLLPQKHRAHSASGAHEGGAYVVLGVLGALLLALLLYVLTVNGINSNTEQLTRVNNEATEAEMRAAALQYVRKVSGYREPSRANVETFGRAVQEITAATERLLAELVVGGRSAA